MKFEFPKKLKSSHLTIALAVLAFVLIAMGGLGIAGVPIPSKLSSDISNGVILMALVVFFYSRKMRSDEAKAAAEKAKLESHQEAEPEETPET
ncbi:MAG TPA: hypothetical protein VMC79_03180 [Rectinemataceae bacterium]|nr:hypothetical protein [Rectinemataceae bacterium]